MYVRRLTVTVTVDNTESGTGYSDPIPYGRLSHIRYVKSTLGDDSTFLVTSDTRGETLWSEVGVNASATRAPRQPTHSTAGVAAVYAAAGTAVQDMIEIVNDRIKVVVSLEGGEGQVATFHFIIL
jgi:hypothetical protein